MGDESGLEDQISELRMQHAETNSRLGNLLSQLRDPAVLQNPERQKSIQQQVNQLELRQRKQVAALQRLS